MMLWTKTYRPRANEVVIAELGLEEDSAVELAELDSVE